LLDEIEFTVVNGRESSPHPDLRGELVESWVIKRSTAETSTQLAVS